MTKEDIHRICKEYNITNYTINEDYSIDLNVDVDLYYNVSQKSPLRFRNVSGWFDCSRCLFTSLEGAPSYVVGDFYCDNNPLESLKGIPLNLSEDNLFLPKHFTYSDYLVYCRDLKFKKILK